REIDKDDVITKTQDTQRSVIDSQTPQSPTLEIEECIYHIQQLHLYLVLEIELHSTWPRVSDNFVVISLSFNLSANIQYPFVDLEFLTCPINFFNLIEIWPLLAGIVMSSFHYSAQYLLSLMDRPCLLSILFNQSKKVALGHTVRSLDFGRVSE
ncbi:MAG: hypothetical protein EZS28_037743, partial [Streblomastix strix]